MHDSTFRRPPSAPDTLARPEHWGKQAACRTAPTAVFFPEDFAGVAAVERAVEEAKSYCRHCPVVGPCLQEALDRGEAFGVWGGTVAAERRAVLRRAREEAKRGRPQTVTSKAA